MNNRWMTILRELMTAEGEVTGTYLADQVQVTSRTVREDIRELSGFLSDKGAVIEAIRGKGYKLDIRDESSFAGFLEHHQSEESVPSDPEERQTYLLRRLLLAKDFIKIEEIADEIYVSPSTLQNDLKGVKEILDHYELRVEKKPGYGMRTGGLEVMKRFCLAESFADRKDKEANVLMNEFEDDFLAGAYHTISAIVMERVKEFQLWLSDVALNNLVVHLVIAYKRIVDGNYVQMRPVELEEITSRKEYFIACAITEAIEQRVKVEFPEAEKAYVTMHLLGTKGTVGSEEEDTSELFADNCITIARDIVGAIEQELRLEIDGDEELIRALALHLRPAINRFKYGMNIRNPLLQAVKTNYPLAFEAGVIAGRRLQKRLSINIDENEIGYLAIHIGAAIERREAKKVRQVKKVLIVCASGMGSSQLIKYKLSSSFGEELEIKGTTEYYNLSSAPFHEIDLVISSIPIKEEMPVPVLEVNAVLTHRDIKEIETFLGKSTDFGRYVHPARLFLNEKLGSKQEVLAFLVARLENQGLVNGDFLDKIYEREDIAPTSYGNLVAIPHPITPKWKDTFISICTLEKPVDWNGKKVQVVIMLNVAKDSTEDLQCLYGLLTTIVENKEVVQMIKQCREPKELMEKLEQIY